MTPGKAMKGKGRVLIAGVAQLARAYNIYSHTNRAASKVFHLGEVRRGVA